ncbi:MAG: UDP-N-acetylmuramate--L-alanine ligase [Chlamydiia bacterium]
MSQLYHFIGIGGIGMSALARILVQQGSSVTGSDRVLSPLTEELELAGAQIFSHHCASNISPLATVVYSSDIKPDNPEWVEAKKLRLPLLHRSELLAQLMESSQSLLVTGTHGKTTSSSLLAHVLHSIEWDPTFAVGGVLKNYWVNSRAGHGRYFVAEADESDGSFLAYPDAAGAIITNIGLDHLNYWGSEAALMQGFKDFSTKIKSAKHLLWCKDDLRLAQMSLEGVSYGFDPDADVYISDFIQQGGVSSFSLRIDDVVYKAIELPLIGRHNALNAAAVFALVLGLTGNEKEIRQAFSSFRGVSRRADKVGEEQGVGIYDDYGHHPTEVSSTVSAFKQAFADRRIILVFQPHRYTRMKDCIDEFPQAFTQADVVVLTDLYAAGEAPIEGVSTQALYEKVISSASENIYHIRQDALIAFLVGFVKEGDLVITMGAGDITKQGPLLLERLRSLGKNYVTET